MDIVVPVKDFRLAKSRLASVASPRMRCDLARAMARHVLGELRRVRALGRILVVSGEPETDRIATELGCDRIPDPGCGLNAAVIAGLAALDRRAPAGIVHADLPLLRASSVVSLLAGHRRAGGITLVTDLAGRGTNVLLMDPEARIAPAFGPDSAARHLAAAKAAGILLRTVRAPDLSRDCDTPDDLAGLADRAAILSGALGRTAGRPARPRKLEIAS